MLHRGVSPVASARPAAAAPAKALIALACLAAAVSAASEAQAAAATTVVSLDGDGWTVSNASVSVPASVPGTVPEALFRGGVEGDPRFGYNQNTVLQYSTAGNYTYRRTFATPPEATGAALVQLVFDGVDTAAAVSVNGHLVGQTRDMHLQYQFDVTGLLVPPGSAAGNTLEVHIESAVEFAARQAARHGDPGCKKWNRGPRWPSKFGHDTVCSTYIRKNTGSFGWDCARAFVAQGIWKGVRLRVVPSLAIDEVVPVISGSLGDDPGASNAFHVETKVFFRSAGPADIVVTAEGSWAPGNPVRVHASVAGAGEHNVTLDTLAANNVALWWPNGLGAPTLYNLTVTITIGSRAVTTAQRRVGFRTFEFVGSVGNNTQHYGNASLFFRVNGRPTFAKGHNWMPSNVLIADTADDRAGKRARIADARAVGANTIRIWGGGIYETQAFYDAADEMGIMVMQDGSFFGSYPQYDGFYDLVAQEIAYNARRLAAHPSLVVYSGNNEGSVFGDVHLYVDVQLATMQRENPNVVVYPSCPAYGWASLSPLVPRPDGQPACQEGHGADQLCPHDSHYYGPCGTIPDGTNFGSEFGWPSADLGPILDRVTPKGQNVLRPATGGSPFLDYRSTVLNPDWAFDSMLYTNSTLVKTFPTLLTEEDATTDGMWRWLYLTQALQTHCVGGSISTYRQHAQVMGSLNWAINSIWTAPAWGSISHDGTWKMLHYRLRHLFAPVLLSFNRPVPAAGALRGKAAPMPSNCPQGSVCLHLSNHHDDAYRGACALQLRGYARGEVFASYPFHVSAPANQGVDTFRARLDALIPDNSTELCGPAVAACFFTAHCVGDDGRLSESQPLFPSSLAAARLSAADISVSNVRVTGTSASLAVTTNTTTPFAFLFSEAVPGVFSDNSMTLLPGEVYNFTFTSAQDMPSASQFAKGLSVYSVNNKLPTAASPAH